MMKSGIFGPICTDYHCTISEKHMIRDNSFTHHDMTHHIFPIAIWFTLAHLHIAIWFFMCHMSRYDSIFTCKTLQSAVAYRFRTPHISPCGFVGFVVFPLEVASRVRHDLHSACVCNMLSLQFPKYSQIPDVLFVLGKGYATIMDVVLCSSLNPFGHHDAVHVLSPA